MRTTSELKSAALTAVREKVAPDTSSNGVHAHQLGVEAENATVPMPAYFIIIDRRSFVRDCVQAMLSKATGMVGVGLSSVEEFLANAVQFNAAVIIICAPTAYAASEELMRLKASTCQTPVVVMSDADDAESIILAMEKGANGYTPSDISIEVIGHALRLVVAGGQYFPAAKLVAARRNRDDSRSVIARSPKTFTRRQVAVIDALRRGKANKIIAYELNMCESTVKVHVRNIMKKLNAKNRTEVAYLANELLAAREI